MISSDSLVLDEPTTADLAVARGWCRQLLGERFDDAELVLNELLANAILHGDPGPVVADLAIQGSCAVISVTNTSAGKLPEATPLSSTVSGKRGFSSRGRGLMIASAIAERLVTSRRGNRVMVLAAVPLESGLGGTA